MRGASGGVGTWAVHGVVWGRECAVASAPPRPHRLPPSHTPPDCCRSRSPFQRPPATLVGGVGRRVWSTSTAGRGTFPVPWGYRPPSHPSGSLSVLVLSSSCRRGHPEAGHLPQHHAVLLSSSCRCGHPEAGHLPQHHGHEVGQGARLVAWPLARLNSCRPVDAHTSRTHPLLRG